MNSQRGIELLRYLESIGEIITTVWEGTERPVLDFWLFKCSPSEDLEKFWQARLGACHTDAELFSITLAAESGVATAWLRDTTLGMRQSDRLLDRAIGLTLAGFSITKEAGELLESVEQQSPDGWLRTVATRAGGRWRSNQWARHWFRQFATAESEVEAWAGFRLFLRVVDSRFWWWNDDDVLDATRRTFLEDNEDVVERAIRDNEKGLKDSYAGQKVLERECAPWMRDYQL